MLRRRLRSSLFPYTTLFRSSGTRSRIGSNRDTASLTMNVFTRVFLVLLRLAIGWHFLIEGVEKIESVRLGLTETSRPWTSEGYVREASGPLVGLFRRQFGDPDAAALERLTVQPLPAGQDSSHVP